MKTTMKTFFLVSLSVLLFTSCKNEDNDDPSSETNNQFVLSGTISNYTSGTIDALKFWDDLNESIISTGIPSSDGKFSITLPIPTTKPLSEMSLFPDNLTISDANAQIGGGGELSVPYAYKANSFIGYVCKSSTSVNLGSSSSRFNGTITQFLYCDRAFTIKGTYKSETQTLTYNLTLKKGWNEIALTQNSSTITYSTTIPADLKWYYFTESSN